MEVYVAVMDTLILVWLIGTWFYEGHHKQCKVETVCKVCGTHLHEDCQAGK